MSRTFRASMRLYWVVALFGLTLSGGCLSLGLWVLRIWYPELEDGGWATLRAVSAYLPLGLAAVIWLLLVLIWREHAGTEYLLTPDGLCVTRRGHRARFHWERMVFVPAGNPRSPLARAILSDGEKTHVLERFFLPEFDTLCRLLEAGSHRRDHSLTPGASHRR
ncbi:MAG: hypothetical protein AB1758_15310 [Candidatus Eremiobacterota bacterium]